MKQTALQNALQNGANAVFSEYRGTLTAANFGDPEKEFQALRNSCGVYDLGFRSKISLTGNDRVRWLNGMVSNNIKSLPVNQGVYAFMLNPQGHILADLYAYNRGESIVVDTDSSQLEKVLALFTRYIIMDKVEVKDLSEQLTAIGIAGPKSREVLRAAGIEMPELAPLQVATPKCDCDCACLECTVVHTDDPANESYEIWLTPDTVKQTWDALLKVGAAAVGWHALEKNRIASGIPLYGVDIRERELPQETGQMRALNFQKGCYIGQEIVERIRSRGNVHRQFMGFVLGDGAAIQAADKISLAEKEVGEITSVSFLRQGDGMEHGIALGYVRREAGSPGREVKIGPHTAVVASLPLLTALPQVERALV